jgi:uncharacterized protein YqeY
MLRSIFIAQRATTRSFIRPQRLSASSRALYSTSTDSPPPSLLPRLRDELKTAMRARDTPRLNVLRAVLADITNLSKTNTPVKDDLALLALLKKRMGSVRQSIQEFYEADRKELVAKEEEQLKVLEDYASNIQVLSQHEVRAVVEAQVDELQANGKTATLSEVMKKCTGPGGAFEGQMVEKSLVASTVKEVLATKNSTS